MRSGERGPTGDHGQAGQDGREGRRGEAGPRGPAGGTSQGERGERGKQGGPTPALRLRLLILYVVVVSILAVVLFSSQHFQSETAHNCATNRQNTINFNSFIDRLVVSYSKSRVLTEKEKAQRTEFFNAAKGTVPTCPPGGLWP